MDHYFTKTFFKFLFGFLVIIGVAFGILIGASSFMPKSVDNIAHPR